MPGNTTQSQSIGLVALVNIGTAVVGVAQAFAVGLLFGTTAGIEIYFGAIAFYQSMVGLMQTGQIAEMFTPLYHELKVSHGSGTAFDLLSVLMNWMIIAAFAFSGVLFFAAAYIVPLTVPGFDSERLAECVLMFQWIVPLLSMNVVLSLLSSLMAGEKQFVAQEICKLFCLILGLVLIVSLAGIFDAWVMIGSLWVSTLTNLALFAVLVYRLGYRYRPIMFHPDFSVRQIFINVPSVFGYVFMTQLYSIALTAGLSMLPQGSLAIFTYAWKISGRISSILVRPIATVFFNHFSSALANGDLAIANLTRKALSISLVFSTFACLITLTGGFAGLKALWLSPKFPEADVFRTYILICVLCFLPLISGAGLIFRKINMSHQLVRPQYFLLTLVQLISALLAYFLIEPWGLVGAVTVAVLNTVLIGCASAILLINKTPGSFSIYR